MRRALRVVADLALTVGALVGVACLVAAVASVAFGVHPLIFRSGSMAPTIPAGSLAFARDVPAADIRVGDVVSVPWHDSRVTHRVVEVFHRNGSATLKLRGDANDAPDSDLYQVSSAPRVWFSVPVAGRVVAWLSRAPGVFVLAAYAALLLTIVFRRVGTGGGARPIDEDDPPRSPRRRHRGGKRRASRRLRLTVVGSTALALGTVTASPTWAAWTDAGTVSGSTLATYTVPVPQNFNCGTIGVLSVTFSWSAVAGATNYTLHTGTNGTTTQTVNGTSATVTTLISGGTAWVNANINYGSTTWTSGNSNTRSYTVAVASLCA